MSSSAPAELSASLLIQRIVGGEYPREVVETIARGFLPLPQEDLIAVLSFLITHGDAELSAIARSSLKDIPSRIVHGFATNERASPQHLGLLMLASEDPHVVEALIRNRAVPDASVVELAARADAAIQEIVVINQARIIRAPEILDALLSNPALSGDVRRRALEAREEFFDKRARVAAAQAELDEEEADLSLTDDPIMDLLEKAALEEGTAAAQPPPELDPAELKDTRNLSVFSRIMVMSVSEKVKLAFKGGKTERVILVRDHNKLVCSAVMRNPRMTNQEAETIAGLRNVEDEVLRIITMKREWMAKYSIVSALVKNPKTPIGVVLPLINRLTLKDLKGLKDDKGIPEVVRSMIKKLHAQRSQKK